MIVLKLIKKHIIRILYSLLSGELCLEDPFYDQSQVCASKVFTLRFETLGTLCDRNYENMQPLLSLSNPDTTKLINL